MEVNTEQQVEDRQLSSGTDPPRIVAYVDVDRTLAKTSRKTKDLIPRQGILAPLIGGYKEVTRQVDGYVLPAWTRFLAQQKMGRYSVISPEYADRIEELEEKVYRGEVSFLSGADQMLRLYLTAVYGRSCEDVERLAEEFAGTVSLYAHTGNLFHILGDNGCEIRPLTSNPEELMTGMQREWEKRFEIRLSPGITTEITRIHGRFSGGVISRPLSGLEKSLLLRLQTRREGISLSDCVYFGDSEFSDGHSLALVGTGYLVNTNGDFPVPHENEIWKLERYDENSLRRSLERSRPDRPIPQLSIKRPISQSHSRIRKYVKNILNQVVDPTDIIALMQIVMQCPLTEERKETIRTSARRFASLISNSETDIEVVAYITREIVAGFQDTLEQLPVDNYMDEIKLGTKGVKVAGVRASEIVEEMYPFPGMKKDAVESWVRRASENFLTNRGYR